MFRCRHSLSPLARLWRAPLTRALGATIVAGARHSLSPLARLWRAPLTRALGATIVAGARHSLSPLARLWRAPLSRVLGAAIVAFALTATVHSGAQDKDLTEAADFRVRVQAALRLGKVGGAQSRADLERGLKDAHPAVRVACAVGLGTIGDPAAVPALQQAMKGESFASVKTAMKEAIDKLRSNPSKGGDAPMSIERAKYVVQVGNMRNNTGVRPGDLDGVMKEAARAKANSISGAVVVDGSDTSVLQRASERRIPVILVDGNLSRLTQSTGRDGGVIVSARVDLSIRKIPQQVLRGMVSGNASASEDSRGSRAAIAELQNRAVGGAMESAMSSVSSEIAALSK